MSRRGRSGTMQVLLNGRLVGYLSLANSGAISFAYNPDLARVGARHARLALTAPA